MTVSPGLLILLALTMTAQARTTDLLPEEKASSPAGVSSQPPATLTTAAPVFTPSGDAYKVESSGNVGDDVGASLTLKAIGSPSVYGTATAVVEAQDNRMRRVTLTGELRAVGVAAGASIWMRVEDKGTMLMFANGDRELIQGDSDWTPRSYTLPIPSSATSISFGAALGPGGGTLEIRHFKLSYSPLPDAPMSAGAKALLDQAVVIVKANALASAKVDWTTAEAELHAISGGASEPSDVYPTIRYLLALLRDGHSRFLSPSATKRAQGAGRENLPSNVRLEQGIGYVEVPSYGNTDSEVGRKQASEMHNALKGIAPSVRCGWIVDLRGNAGGNMYPMLNGLEPLLGSETLGWFVTGETRTPWTARGSEGAIPPPDLERLRDAWVAVLTGPRTASSGEVVAISFKGRPRTRLFGQATRGLTTANKAFELSDGSSLVLAVSLEADRSGSVYHGQVEPDEPTAEVDTEPAAIRWLRASSHCEPPGR